jgi:hypothetical protein
LKTSCTSRSLVPIYLDQCANFLIAQNAYEGTSPPYWLITTWSQILKTALVNWMLKTYKMRTKAKKWEIDKSTEIWDWLKYEKLTAKLDSWTWYKTQRKGKNSANTGGKRKKNPATD